MEQGDNSNALGDALLGGGDGQNGSGGDNGSGGGNSSAGTDTLILGKFKTQEDLVKAYREAESALGKRNNEFAALQKQLEEQRMQPPATQAVQATQQQTATQSQTVPPQQVRFDADAAYATIVRNIAREGGISEQTNALIKATGLPSAYYLKEADTVRANAETVYKAAGVTDEKGLNELWTQISSTVEDKELLKEKEILFRNGSLKHRQSVAAWMKDVAADLPKKKEGVTSFDTGVQGVKPTQAVEVNYETTMKELTAAFAKGDKKEIARLSALIDARNRN